MTTTLPDWPELLASALVGAERRPVHHGLSTVEDPALGLLDAAAAVTAYRRAGVPVVTGLVVPAPAGDESVPLASPAAVAGLIHLLDQDSTGGDWFDAEMRGELLAEWLSEAARAGRRCPFEVLPALLDAGRRDRSLRPLIVAIGGARAGWLARQRPEWAYLARERDVSDPAAWETGTAGQRVAHLAAVRATDPDAGRELLAAGWAGEAPDERAALLDTLRAGLSLVDEGFLEQALADRRKEVRGVAGELLGRLPGSAYRSRMVARAQSYLRREGDRLVVEPPVQCDAAMKRDGIVPKPPQGVGERAWWLEQVLARTPVEIWTDGDPAEFLALKVPDDWELVLLRGLARATVTAGHPDWAATLFDRGSTISHQDRRSTDVELFNAVTAIVPDARLADHVAALLRHDPNRDTLYHLLARCPRPWPPALVDAALSALALPTEQHMRQAGRGNYIWWASRLGRIAAARLPVAAADRVAALAGTVRAHAADLTERIDRLAQAKKRRAELTGAAAADSGPGTESTNRTLLVATESLANSLELIIDVLRFRHDLQERTDRHRTRLPVPDSSLPPAAESETSINDSYISVGNE